MKCPLPSPQSWGDPSRQKRQEVAGSWGRGPYRLGAPCQGLRERPTGDGPPLTWGYPPAVCGGHSLRPEANAREDRAITHTTEEVQ